MPLSLPCDEQIPYQVIEGLRRREIDVVSIQQMDLRSTSDDVILDIAQRQGRVIYSRDTDFLRLLASGTPHAGNLYHHPVTYSVGAAIRTVAMACEVLSMDEMRNHVEFL
jgi:predicted nuclease of predicted toxin-antitoxin system